MVEKRRANRASVNMRINYVDHAHRDKMGNVMNISTKGMFVQTGVAPEVNEFVEGTIDNEDFGKVLWVEGRVVRKSRSGMALAFTNTDAKGLQVLLASKHALS